MKPTIKMIADYAGVSRGVVDRVLHGRPNVNPRKRKRVEDALKELNYSPDLAARALALKNRGITVTVVLPRWAGSFNTEVPRGIETARTELKVYGMEVLVTWCGTELDTCSPRGKRAGKSTIMKVLAGVNTEYVGGNEKAILTIKEGSLVGSVAQYP